MNLRFSLMSSCMALSVACGSSDGGTGGSETSGSGGSETGTTATTNTSNTSAPTTGMTSDASTSAADTMSPTSGPEGSGTAADGSGTAAGSETGSGSGSAGSSSGGSGSGGVVGDAYGPCDLTDPENPTCPGDEQCAQGPNGDNWCGVPCDMGDASGCPDSPNGAAVVECSNGFGQCALDCTDDSTVCPDGMDCIQLGSGGRCVWPAPA